MENSIRTKFWTSMFLIITSLMLRVNTFLESNWKVFNLAQYGRIFVPFISEQFISLITVMFFFFISHKHKFYIYIFTTTYFEYVCWTISCTINWTHNKIWLNLFYRKHFLFGYMEGRSCNHMLGLASCPQPS